jgi:ubiquinone/menaquinone biosynthesis C-methylase UbiE
MTDLYAFGEIYDPMVGGYDVDIAFYVSEAERAEPPVLELACGTGRVLIPIAEAGVWIWGLDMTEPMLEKAREKVTQLPVDVQSRITLERGDMRAFDLPERFGLVTVPFRSFLHLKTVEEQLAALGNVRRHLKPGGRLALNFFHPSIPIIADHMTPTGQALKPFREWTDPATGHRVVGWETRKYRPSEQIVEEIRILETIDETGQVLDRSYRSLSLRWIYRFEFEHLLARSGFVVEALYGDFDRSPFMETSSELIWVARRDG